MISQTTHNRFAARYRCNCLVDLPNIPHTPYLTTHPRIENGYTPASQGLTLNLQGANGGSGRWEGKAVAHLTIFSHNAQYVLSDE